MLVGGCIRDHFLNLPIKDYDIEVFNIESFDTLASHLEAFGSVNLVGKSFGVLKLQTSSDTYDFALPRTEKKVNSGHQGFEVTSNPNLSYKEAAIRRDFTINQISYDYATDTFIDPFNGIEDIKNKILRHINETTFIEDPLRVYRAVQFASRFEFTLDKKTLQLCQKMVNQKHLDELPKERVFEEFKKFLLKAKRPSLGFELLKELGVLGYFNELEALIDCEQEHEYHPEGDVWVHTLMTLDEMAKLRVGDEKRDLLLMLAILCHDLGKPFCTKVINGKITSHKHESLGLEPTMSFLSKLTNEKRLIEEVLPLVKYHLAPFQFYLQSSSVKAIKRLSTKVNIENLCLVCLADCLGRDIDDKDKCAKAIDWLLEESKKLNISNEGLKPLVQGRDLIALGFKPSKIFKEILDFSFDLQIDEDLKKEQIIEKIKEAYL